MPIRPILLKGHTRPLTCVKFNRDGDLLFTCAKDHVPSVWYADNGERLGTYSGHAGAVNHCDISYNSDRLLTGSADRSVKLWDVRYGKCLRTYQHKSGVRSVGFAHGESMFLSVQDNTFSSQPTIFIYNLTEGNENTDKTNEEDTSERAETDDFAPVRAMSVAGNNSNIRTALWGSLNQTIITCGDDGCLRVWDVEAGVETMKASDHKKPINSIQFNHDNTMIITASSDHTAKLYDAKTLTLLKTYNSDRPLNSASISPLFNHVIIGGGQEAMNVTITSAKVGHFEVDFFHLVYGEFLGSVKGHFGPVNTVAFNTTGKSFASGAEDGYVRLHHFDKEYFNAKNQF